MILKTETVSKEFYEPEKYAVQSYRDIIGDASWMVVLQQAMTALRKTQKKTRGERPTLSLFVFTKAFLPIVSLQLILYRRQRFKQVFV